MLLYKEPNTFMVGPQNTLEPVKRFVKQHFPRSADKIICIRYDLLFRGQREVILARKSKPHRFPCSDSSSDMPLDDVHQLI